MGLDCLQGRLLQGCSSGGDSLLLRRPLPGHWVTDDEGHLWVGLRKDHGLGLWRGWEEGTAAGGWRAQGGSAVGQVRR